MDNFCFCFRFYYVIISDSLTTLLQLIENEEHSEWNESETGEKSCCHGDSPGLSPPPTKAAGHLGLGDYGGLPAWHAEHAELPGAQSLHHVVVSILVILTCGKSQVLIMTLLEQWIMGVYQEHLLV